MNLTLKLKQYDRKKKNINVNTICRFDGICLDDWNRKHIDYESYSNNKNNQNTTFSIEIGIRKFGKISNHPINTIKIDLHFWKFNDEWEIKSSSTKYESLLSSMSYRQLNDFIYENNIMQYIKDELSFWCGIYDDKIIDEIYSHLLKEFKE